MGYVLLPLCRGGNTMKGVVITYDGTEHNYVYYVKQQREVYNLNEVLGENIGIYQMDNLKRNGISMYCDTRGKAKGLPVSIQIRNALGKVVDTLCGNIVFISSVYGGSSLTKRQLNFLNKILHTAVFRKDGKIIRGCVIDET